MSEGVFFTREELEQIDKISKLHNILDFLDVVYDKRNSRAKLIQLILIKQVEMQPYLGDPVPEPPRYSVRIRRIMEAKARGELQ